MFPGAVAPVQKRLMLVHQRQHLVLHVVHSAHADDLHQDLGVKRAFAVGQGAGALLRLGGQGLGPVHRLLQRCAGRLQGALGTFLAQLLHLRQDAELRDHAVSAFSLARVLA